MPSGGNSIAWLLWHAARQMDVQLLALSGGESVWRSGDWAQRLGVHRDEDDFGMGDSPDDVSALQVSDVAALGEYLGACVEALVAYLRTAPDLGEVIDASYTPPVTRATRILSMVNDAVTHVGQAAYVRGIVDDWSIGV